MMTPNDHDLLLAYLNRELPTAAVVALQSRLKTESGLADSLVLLAREESILTEWAHSSAVGCATTRVSPGARRSRFVSVARWSAAAAVLALVVWGVFRLT